MKRLMFLALVSSVALLLAGIGCGGDDDDDGSSAGSGGKAGSGEADAGGAGSGEADAGEAGSGGSGGTGGAPVSYDCGGEDAECDLLDADSCEEGYGCQFLLPSIGSGAAFAQCTEAGDGKDGDDCDDDNPCEPGLHCQSGTCHKYCCEYGSSTECPANQACVIALSDGKGGTSDVSVCDACDECNPLTLEGCDDGLGCYPIQPEDQDEDIGCRLCLSSVGDKEAGDVCEAVNECKPGLGCYSVEGGDSECVPFCDLDEDPDPCDPGTTCQDSAGSEAMGLSIGICLSP
jgi:hypothetical protein